MLIRFNGKKLGEFVTKTEPLYKDKVPRWLEHSRGGIIDVIALPLSIPTIDNTVTVYPLDLLASHADFEKAIVEVSSTVFIVGFPFGVSSSGFPVWKVGHIASEPFLNDNNLPRFMIDATTRGGMSGSPVFLRNNSGIFTLK